MSDGVASGVPTTNASPGELSGMVAVVTGSSSGIGRAIALELAAAGANCLIHAARSEEAAKSVAADIAARGVSSRVELCDISDAAACAAFVEAAWQWRDGVDIWVNNAGADVLTGPLSSLSYDEKLDMLWRVDVSGTFRLSRDAGQRMRQRGSGVVINMGWDQAASGLEGNAGQIFATAKGAIASFTMSLAKSLAPEVRALCIAPGWIRTAWGERANEYWQRRGERESLAGRWGTPEDVAHVVRFLASPNATFVNGQTIAINGGLAK